MGYWTWACPTFLAWIVGWMLMPPFEIQKELIIEDGAKKRIKNEASLLTSWLVVQVLVCYGKLWRFLTQSSFHLYHLCTFFTYTRAKCQVWKPPACPNTGMQSLWGASLLRSACTQICCFLLHERALCHWAYMGLFRRRVPPVPPFHFLSFK